MRINECIALVSANLLLVPYEAFHVPTYHVWMSDPDLQAATASEEQTLEEQYANQASWREDHDKLTFIICLHSDMSSTSEKQSVISGKDDRSKTMIGDINLYLYPCIEANESEIESGQKHAWGVKVELSLMIASENHYRQGYGRTALLMFLSYTLANWGDICAEYSLQGATDSCAQLAYFFVKINHNNHRSLRFFESVGFLKVNKMPNIFQEYELRLPVSESMTVALAEIKDSCKTDTVIYERK